MKGIIFDTEEAAKQWDAANNGKNFKGTTTYLWSRKQLADTTTLTKAEYATLFNIPEVIPSAEDENAEAPNPLYEELEESYTLNKFALMVGDNLIDAEETYVNGEVEITEDMLPSNEE